MPSPTHHTMAKMDRRDDAHGAEEDLLPEHMQAPSAHEDEHRIRSSVQHSTLAARTPAEGSHCSSPERAPRNASPSLSGCREALRSERSSISAMVRQSSSSSSSRVEAPNYQTCQPSDAAPSTTHKTPHTLTYVGDLDLDEVDDPLAIPRRTSTLKAAAFHIFKGNVGAGVFLLPAYYQDAGYVLGALLVIVLGLVMIDCSLSLLRAKRRINDPAIVSYPAVVDYVLGPWFRLFTQFSLIFTHFGFCVIYVQYAASMFAALFTFPYAYQVFVGVCVCVVTPITFLTHRMQLLGYVSFTAGLFIAVVLAGTTYLNLLHLWEEGPTLTAFAFIPGARLAVFLSGHMFSLEGIGVLLPVENSLSADRKPKLAKLVECLLMSIVVLYITFGILGYIAFGQSITTSVVLALPPSWMKYVLQVLLGLSLILGYPIQYVPAIEVVDGAMGIHIQRDRKLALVVRTSLNLVFGVVAMCIGGDTINIVASFLGAFVGVHFMITIPSLLALQIDHAVSGCQSTMSYPSYLMLMFRPPWPWSKLIRFGYLVFALIIWCSGLYFTASSVFASA